MDTGNSTPSRDLVELKFAELHAPLFMAGTNMQLKLDPTKRIGLDLKYDPDERMLRVHYKTEAVDETALVPLSSVLSVIPGSPKKQPVIVPPMVAPMTAGAPKKAQVSGPHDHVFAGPGGGKR